MANAEHRDRAKSQSAVLRFYDLRKQAVSRSFIASLAGDGVSRGTIEAIKRDNVKRAAA